MDGATKDGPIRIADVTAYCSQNQTRYTIAAPYFCDASGDGILGFQAGAAFRMGAEKPEVFGEGFAPDDTYGELLGHTIYFYSKDTGHPVRYVPPAFALKDITKIPRFRNISARQNGLNFWWIEYGGRRDTIAETEAIKWELWKVVYGIWDYIKNSGKFPEAETMTLEWVGTIPGKRESRRFEGDYMLTQQDIVEQRRHSDAVAVGGWSIDLHPSDGIYSEKPPCNQYHSKGVYQIPFRCYFSRNIENLFLAGRIISASHVAFGSTRVMLTCAHGGAAVGMAAARCLRENLQPRDLLEPEQMTGLQADLNRTGHRIPGIPSSQSDNLAAEAVITASSTLKLANIPADGGWRDLEFPIAQLLPYEPDSRPEITLRVRSAKSDRLRVVLRAGENPANTTPDLTLEEQSVALLPGEQTIRFRFDATVPTARYIFICFYGNGGIEIPTSAFRCTGALSVAQRFNKAVATTSEQAPPPDLGIDRFEFWIPTRRPGGHNIALHLDPPLKNFAAPDYLTNGYERPWLRSNAWIADPADANPKLVLRWKNPVSLRKLTLHFDTDFDHAMETTHKGHPEDVMPFCVRAYTIRTADGSVLREVTDNHQTVNCVHFDGPTITDELTIELDHPGRDAPAALFGLHIC